MGEIVWAATSNHAPDLLTNPPYADPAVQEACITAMAELGAGLDETKPDALIVVGIDHVETFFPGSVPTFAIVTGETATSGFAEYERDLPIHQPLADALLTGLVAEGIDVAYAHEAHLGHAFAVPFEFIHGGRAIPVIPMFVNVYLPPLPTARRCFQVGQAIATIVAARNERVAILGSGGMSHYPGTWKMWGPEHDFDRWLAQELEEGNIDALLDLTGEQLDETGNTELLAWALTLGASPPAKGELLLYQATEIHGRAVMRFLPDKRTEPYRHVDMPPFGGFHFKGQGYEFYKYPTPKDYPLNRALSTLKNDTTLLRRFVRDMDGVCADLGLTQVQTTAMKTLSTAKVVEQGGHGLLALITMLAVQDAAREAGLHVDSVF